MFSLADPWFLILLLVPLVPWLWMRGGDSGGAALVVPDSIVSRLSLSSDLTGRSVQSYLPLAAWMLVVGALAGPQILVPNPALPVSGRDLVLALDLSGSMIRKDFAIDGREVSRLDALRQVGTEFILRRGGDRVALVIFASRAYYATPQTHDVEAVAQALDSAEIGISGRATGIGDGLGLALKRLRDSDATSKVVVLLSDGSNNSGPVRPRDAARLASDLGVRVHTIAMGPKEKTHAREHEAVDAKTLEDIARLSGGTFFRVKSTEDLVGVTQAIDELEQIPTSGPSALIHRELWIWPAILSIIAVLAHCGLTLRR